MENIASNIANYLKDEIAEKDFFFLNTFEKVCMVGLVMIFYYGYLSIVQ